MGTVIQEFQLIQLQILQSPTSDLNNYSMSGAKIAFILLVITMLTASASGGKIAVDCCIEKGIPDICNGLCIDHCIETPDEAAMPDFLKFCTEYEPIVRECCEKEKGK